jgi:hypothetical protein
LILWVKVPQPIKAGAGILMILWEKGKNGILAGPL